MSLVLLLCISNVYAQHLKPACQVGATWNYIYFTGGTQPQSTFLHTVRCIKDTAIGDNIVSIIEVDSSLSYNFLRYSYLAIDDSNGLYFLANNQMDFGSDTLLLACRFKEGNFLTETVHVIDWNTTYVGVSTIHFSTNKKSKFYSSNDSIEAFQYGINFGGLFLCNPIHPKYLNLNYGTNPNHVWGTPDFSRSFDSDYMILNCYTDSTGTTKFIQQYASHDCDYLGLPQLVETKQWITVFPNPCTNQFFVSEVHRNSVEEITVQNVLGETLITHQRTAQNANQGVDVSKLATGMYSVTLSGPNARSTQKLFIQH